MTELKLPFKLQKNHKSMTKGSWKKIGIKFTDEEFEYWYNKYIYATNCELCNEVFKTSRNRHLDHNHDTGEIRNIICRTCNFLKKDNKIYSNNKTGYTGIYKINNKRYIQGFYYQFEVHIDKKLKVIKSSIDFDWLVKYAEEWKKENNYYT